MSRTVTIYVVETLDGLGRASGDGAARRLSTEARGKRSDGRRAVRSPSLPSSSSKDSRRRGS